jgi:ribonuclease BN (tRNA processing enzyme)
MELTVLGAGPAYTDRPGATGAAYLVRDGVTAVLLDFGQGSFPRLTAEIEPSMLDAIFVSHLHPDHFIDLVALRHYLRYEFAPPRRVRVVGPAGLDGRLDALHAEPGFTAEALDVSALAQGHLRVGSLDIEARLVTHTEESYGFRVVANGAGPGLVYSGDCGTASDLAPLIRPGDVLLTEVSFGSGPVPPGAQHLNAQAVGELAAATHAERVLLTHLQMGNDEAAAIDAVRTRFEEPVELVVPGSRFTI